MCLHPSPSQQGSFTYEKDFVTVGPWGGRGGHHWDDGVQDSVREIIITYGSGIDSIIFLYEKQGDVYTSSRHGGNGGNRTQKVKLNHPEEYLLAMRGFYGPIFGHDGPVCVRSLTFFSNVRDYGPFGVEQGHSFTFQMVGGKILGFYGKDGWYLDSIGVYVKHIICPQNPPESLKGSGSCSVIEEDIADKYDVLAIKLSENHINANSSIPAQISKPIVASDEDDQAQEKSGALIGGIVSYGPWGGNGGTVFGGGISSTGIKQISLSMKKDSIVGIRLRYDHNGNDVWGSDRGTTYGVTCTKSIVLDYPYEILTNISSYYAPAVIYGPTVIRSLTFHTSTGKYGPYGEEVGLPFCSNLTEGTIVGVHGRTSGLLLHAIGIYVKEGKLTDIGSSLTWLDDN